MQHLPISRCNMLNSLACSLDSGSKRAVYHQKLGKGSHQICKGDKGNLCALQGGMHMCSQGCHSPEKSVIGKAVLWEETRCLAEQVIM